VSGTELGKIGTMKGRISAPGHSTVRGNPKACSREQRVARQTQPSERTSVEKGSSEGHGIPFKEQATRERALEGSENFDIGEGTIIQRIKRVNRSWTREKPVELGGEAHW